MDAASFKGVYSATFTPYDKRGNLDFEMQEKVINFHLRNGIRGVYLCGSTGEGPLLNESERVMVAKNAITCCQGKGKAIIHVGHVSTETAIALAKKAKDHGADAVSSIQPYYYHFSEEIEARYYQELSDAVDLPMIIYIYPKVSGEGTSEKHLLKLLNLKNVVGAKYTGSDYFVINSVFKKLASDKILFSGADELMMVGLCFGTSGAIGAFQNIIPKPFVKLRDAFTAGKIKEMRQLQSRINDLIGFVITQGDMSYFKAAMRYIGFDCGCARRPFKQLTEKEYCSFAKQLEPFDDLFAMSK
ncbi:MAG: dihydrodipicolinate synthase family protein [bacterium]